MYITARKTKWIEQEFGICHTDLWNTSALTSVRWKVADLARWRIYGQHLRIYHFKTSWTPSSIRDATTFVSSFDKLSITNKSFIFDIISALVTDKIFFSCISILSIVNNKYTKSWWSILLSDVQSACLIQSTYIYVDSQATIGLAPESGGLVEPLSRLSHSF